MANATSAFPADGMDVQANLTLVETISQWPAAAWENRGFLLLEARIVGTALACIYLGSHGALRRPPSAKPPKKAKKGSPANDDEQDDEQDADDQYVQGLLPSDAILFPILAGVVLVGLYYLIKWLEDPAILNKILGLYFSLMSLASMGKLLADGLRLLTSAVFPDTWRASGGTVYHFDPARQSQYRMTGTGERVYDENKTTPFPMQAFSQLKVSGRTRTALWETRHVLLEKWTVGLRIHGLVKERFQVQLNDIFGFVLALGANVAYQTTGSVFLSNLMGYAFSYTGIIMMSPTTFTTGSAVLFGLFFYDIYMVFYTPYMVTVATKLDVPIKLVFEGPQKASMLGLGDIVVPGMFIGICLRFDHFLHYYRQRKLVPVELQKEDETSGELVTTTETRRMAVRPEYVSPQGQWANRFWSTPLARMCSPDATPALTASAFRKTYFHAAMFGYLLGMMATLMMLLVFKHAQPALLYLVPGVVFSVWATGALRGELHEMWIYTEDGSLDKEDVLVEVDGQGNVVKEIEDNTTKKDKKEEEGKQEKQGTGKDQGEKSPKSSAKKPKNRTVVSFTIEAPASPTAKED